MLRLFGGMLAALALVGVARADGAPQYGPAPAWVKPLPPAAQTAPAGGAAVQVLSRDSQMAFGPDGDDFYQESATRVLTAQGLSALGNILLSWQPDTDRLTIHQIEIIRGDRRIDLLDGGRKVTVVRRETNLELAMLDGTLTATIQPEGLQVGDILQIAFTLHHKDPALGGMSSGFWALSPSRIDRDHLRAIWPSAKPMRWRATDGVAAPTIAQTADGQELLIDMTAAEAPTPPRGAPARFGEVGQLEFSQFQSWAQLSTLMRPLYDKAAAIGPESPLKAEIARIAAQSSDPATRAMAALKLVQDDVRYVFLGMNDGDYVPASADLTWRRRFGDCKGKTALLLALLNGLGIDATPAFVSSGRGDGLDAQLPSMSRFDHVLVRVRIGDRVYWLDGTRAGDRDLADIPTPNFHWALPLSEAGGALEKLAPPPFKQPQFESDLSLDATAGLDAPAPAHVTYLFRGDGATVLHLALAAQSPADRERYLKEFWRSTVSWIEPTKVATAYDDADGALTLSMDGVAKIDWSKGDDGRDFNVEDSSIGFEANFEREPGPHADAPYAVGYPEFKQTKVTVRLPAAGAGFVLANAQSVDEKVGAFQYHRTARLEAGIATIETSEQSLAPEFSASDAKLAAPEFTRLYDHDVVIRATPQASQPAIAGDLKTEQDAIEDAQAKYRQGNAEQAYASLKSVVAAPAFNRIDAPQQREALYMLSYAAYQQADFTVAHDAAKRTLALGDDDPSLWSLRLSAATHLKDDDDTSLALQVLAKRWPASLGSLSDRYLLSLPKRFPGKSGLKLFQAIYDAHWTPQNKAYDASPLWFALAQQLVDAGDIDRAAKVAAEIHDYRLMIQMRADKRFDPITRRDPTRFDPLKALDARLTALRALAAQAPDQLQPINEIAEILMTTNKLDEALALLDHAVAQSHVEPGEKAGFKDVDDQLNQTFERRAEVLELLGRDDEALRSRDRGAVHTEHGGANVSQRLDLAARLDQLGRPKEALDALEDFDPNHASPFGVMVWEHDLACAYAQLSDQANLAKAMRFMSAHAADNPGIYEDTLLCAGDSDGTAKAVIADLENLETRSHTLAGLQHYLSPSAAFHRSPWDQVMRDRSNSITARSDVQAEIAKVGRVETYPFFDQ